MHFVSLNTHTMHRVGMCKVHFVSLKVEMVSMHAGTAL